MYTQGVTAMPNVQAANRMPILMCIGYDRKGLYQTGTGNRIFNSAIPVLLTGTGFFFWLSGSGLSGTGILKSHSGSG